LPVPSSWHISGWKRHYRYGPIPAWAVLASILIHAFVIALVWHSAPFPLHENRRRPITLRLPRQSDIIWTSYGSHLGDSKNEKAWQPRKAASPHNSGGHATENPATTANQDEVYLPQEVLTAAATPSEEIDLQGESPPGPGGFRITLWISKDGLVTQVDLEDSETPIWFTDRIIEIFKQSKFVPGMREDRPVASTLLVEVTF